MSFFRFTKKFLLLSVVAIFLGCVTYMCDSIWAQTKKSSAIEKDKNFNRPKPTQPIAPTIPGANRYQTDKVFLEYADSLFRPMFDEDDKQIVKGNVKFRQAGLWMYCDSAYYYPERNSIDAFGHVKMRQGDTLFVYADKLYYDGAYRRATLTHGPSQRKVILKDSKMTLTTDSLDYDMVSEIGWYTTGGKLEDKVNTLTSVIGDYSPASKQATFRQDVLLVNRKDGYTMTTEELKYNTHTNIATINTETLIEGRNDTIITSSGWYDTHNDNAELTSRSTIIHKDSASNVTTIEGDSIIYDRPSRISRAYMFNSPWKTPEPMIITDTARKMILIGGYGEYNDSDQSAFSSIYPLLIEFSRPDTLYLRADTIMTYMREEKVWPENMRKVLSANAYARLAAFHSASEIAESMNLTLTLLPDGMIQLESTEISESETEGEMPSDSIPSDSLPGDSAAVDTPVHAARIDALGRDSALMIPKRFRVAKAYRQARFFKQDMQGIADSMEYQEFDSMLYLYRQPIVWSGEREIQGGQINVHLNDSTVDWAFLPQFGLMSEHIDEDFYNQLAGKEMLAQFKDGELNHLTVKGNVETVFLPMENDSSYNRIVKAESSNMTIDMTDRKMDRLKMWPEVTGNMLPLFMVTKRSQKYLQNFSPGAHDALRPVREWYGERVKWADNLGEISEELEEYFRQSRAVTSKPKPRSPFQQPQPAASTDVISEGKDIVVQEENQ